MRIGILKCGKVADNLLSIAGDYDDMIKKRFARISNAEFTTYNVYENMFPPFAQECDLYFATGSSFSVYDDVEWIHKLKTFVKEIFDRKRKFIGFCFGHHLIAESLGGRWVILY